MTAASADIIDNLVVSARQYGRLGTSLDGRSPVDPSERICTRFVVRLIPWPLVGGATRNLDGGVMVIGDSAVATAVVQRLVASGVKACVAACPEVSKQLADLLPDGNDPPRHLMLLDSLDPHWGDAEATRCSARQRRQVVIRYELIQRWYRQNESLGLAGCSLVAATALGTAGGLADGVDQPLDGALTGLIKGIAAEQRAEKTAEFHAIVVDVDRHDAVDRTTAALLGELHCADGNVEVVHHAGNRFSPRPINSLIASSGHDHVAIRPGAWVITGGARGVTAEVALGFRDHPGVKLHLVGSSPVPDIPASWLSFSPEQLRGQREQVVREALSRQQLPAEVWARTEKAIEITRTLDRLAKAGIQAQYHCCDVGDEDAVASMLDIIRRRDGGIVGVIHGAGFEKAARFANKKTELVERTLRAKLDGGKLLMQLTMEDPLGHFIAFGSISGRFGAVGQTDYCMANECLAKLTRWYRSVRPEVATTVIAWHSWDDVGMAVRPESKFSKSLQRLRFMPPEEGVEHLFAELTAGCPEPEVVITDWRYFKLRHPDPLMLPARSVVLDAARRQDITTTSPADIARRHVLRMRPLRRVNTAPQSPPGPALVLGDNPDAIALESRLRNLGVVTDRLSTSGDIDVLLGNVQRLLDQGRAVSLFVLTARDAAASDINNDPGWHRRRQTGIIAPYLVTQKWFAHHATGRQPDAVLVGAVSLGGDFGISGSVSAPEGGAVCGLLKTVRLEAAKRDWSAMRTVIVDGAAELSPEIMTTRILDEAADGSEIEVGIDVRGERFAVAVEMEPAPNLASNTELPQAGDVWIAIGGGRGITAKAALHLAKTYGVKMHLLGSGPPPQLPPEYCDLDASGRAHLKRQIAAQAIAAGESPAKRWLAIERRLDVAETLRQFVDHGLLATYHQCDASDRSALATVLEKIRSVDGPIRGVLQGAGKFQPTRFEAKSRQQIEAMIAAKLDATVAVIALTCHDPLGWFIGFGSIGGRFGSNGNTDYAMTADMQCKLVGWLRKQRPGVRGIGFHWHSWDEVGMMMHSHSYGSRSIMKLTLMPPDEGTRHLDRELRSGAPQSEVVITDDSYRQWLSQPSGRVPAEPVSTGVGVSTVAQTHALIDAVQEHVPGQRFLAECQLRPQADPFLVQHRFRGKPLVPFAIALELITQATRSAVAKGTYIELRDFEFISGIKLLDDRPLPLKVQLTAAPLASPSPRWNAEIRSDFVDSRGNVLQRDRLHARGNVWVGNGAPLGAAAVKPIAPSWLAFPYPLAREAILEHGPIFRRHCGFRASANEAWAQIIPGPRGDFAGERVGRRWCLPPDVIDACLLSCGIHTWLFRQRAVALPRSLAKLAWTRMPQPGETCFQHLRLVEISANSSTYDFQLFDGCDRLIAVGERLVLNLIELRGT